MPSPFPGMNPYLEHPAFWSSFHTRLMVAISDTMAPILRPNYYIEVETRTYNEQEDGEDEDEDLLVGIPDAAVLSASSSKQPRDTVLSDTGRTLTQSRPQPITLPIPTMLKERYLEVREAGTDVVITVIEVPSSKNKKRGKGRVAYERKRSRILGSLSNLIQIDLLRGHPLMTMLGSVHPTHYRIVVSRSEQRPIADLYGFNLQEPIPSFPLPLKPESQETGVNLQAIVQGVCERAGYDDRIDYRQPVPAPALAKVDQQWMNELLASQRDG